jgi:mono/diheme cytochrome c family protein
MQVKIVIGTIAFMLTMMIMGFAALREPTRLEEFTHAFDGRSIETGAKIYANNCSTCHGQEGKAELCYDTAGEQIGCQGLPLNYSPLLCGDSADRTQRMNAMNWSGTKEAFVQSVVAAGRAGTAMPVWSAQFGGPMRDDEVANVVAFVLNWESDALCEIEIPTFDWPATAEAFLADFPEGDAANGEGLYVTYGCSGCHGVPDGSVAAVVGPDMSNIAVDGATRVEGYTAADYLYESILEPNAYITEQCPTGPCLGPPSAMPANFAERMATSPQDLADIMAYLLGE